MGDHLQGIYIHIQITAIAISMSKEKLWFLNTLVTIRLSQADGQDGGLFASAKVGDLWHRVIKRRFAPIYADFVGFGTGDSFAILGEAAEEVLWL